MFSCLSDSLWRYEIGPSVHLGGLGFIDTTVSVSVRSTCLLVLGLFFTYEVSCGRLRSVVPGVATGGGEYTRGTFGDLDPW